MISQCRVSVVSTVLNEYGNLPAWFEGLRNQSRIPDEIVIVDGGSTDGTWDLLQGWRLEAPLVLTQQPEASISQGRNTAIELATGEIVVVTDAGTVAGPNWLEALLEPFVDRETDIVSGFFEPSSSSLWQASLGATTLPNEGDVDPDAFLPSSRSVAIRRTWFEAGFCYPEWLDYCEDLVFDLQLKHAGAKFVFQPHAKVQFEPRSTWRGFARQYYRYARGDGKAGLFPKRHAIRYAAYLGLAVTLCRRKPVEIMAAFILGALYTARPVKRYTTSDYFREASLWTRSLGIVLLPLQRFIGDVAKMAGYPAGLIWRLRRFGRIGPGTDWRRFTRDGQLRRGR